MQHQARTRLVLVVSSFNDLTAQFHTFPSEPVGIVEVKRRHANVGRIDALQRLRQWFMPSMINDCESYCRNKSLNYAALPEQNLNDLKTLFTRWQADLIITVSVPIIPMSSLRDVRYGGINLHASLLPAFRGANPLFWQIVNGVEKVGVTVHRLALNADTGDVLAQHSVPRPHGVSRLQLWHQLHVEHGVPLLKRCIETYAQGTPPGTPQPSLSPTAVADHVPFTQLLPLLSAQKISLDGLWDTVSYLDHWPAEALPMRGWHSFFRWVPTSLVRGANASDFTDNTPIRLIGEGIYLRLMHRDGCIIFSPRPHLLTLLARLLLRR